MNENLILGAGLRLSIEEQNRFVKDVFFRGKMDERHSFCVSEEPVPISEEQLSQFRNVASLVPPFIDGMGRLSALSLIDDSVRRKSIHFRSIRSMLGIERTYTSILSSPDRDKEAKKVLELDQEAVDHALGLSISSSHRLVRLDMISGEDGNMSVVEIEVDKMHGLGYSTFCRMLSPQPIGTGLVDFFSDISRDSRVGIILAADERFYVPEIKAFASEVNQVGGHLEIIFQPEMIIDGSGVSTMHRQPVDKVFNFPSLSGGRKEREELERRLRILQESGQTEFLSDRADFLGEKGTMAMLHNAGQSPEIEALLKEIFGENNLAQLRAVIPHTISLSNIGKRGCQTLAKDLSERRGRFFLKMVDSSGARGVIGPNEHDRLINEIMNGRAKGAILQEAIEVLPFRLPFTNLHTGEKGIDDFSVRFALFVDGLTGQLLDLGITASRGDVAHGGKNSIQTGYVIN